MTSPSPQEQALRLFLARWQEQVRTSFIPRRARTLSTHAALDELLALAESTLRSGGETRPSIDPEEGGHGVRMLADVSAEAVKISRADAVLKTQHPARLEAAVTVASRLKDPRSVSVGDVATLRALVVRLRDCALRDACVFLRTCLDQSSPSYGGTAFAAEAMVSELRALGWSDSALGELGAEAIRRSAASSGDIEDTIRYIESEVARSSSDYVCYVAVDASAKLPPFPNARGLKLCDALPKLATAGRALRRGKYLEVKVAAYDRFSAAEVAHRRVIATLGALSVFLRRGHVSIASDIVAVRVDGDLHAIEVGDALPPEKRRVREDEQTRIVETAWLAASSGRPDPLHDALRLRHRALLSKDAESRLLLLWSGLERLTSGAAGYGTVLHAAKDLTAHAIAFGKLRRDIGDLTATLFHATKNDLTVQNRLRDLVGAGSSASERRLDRQNLLERVLDRDEVRFKELTGVLHEKYPLAAFRLHELRAALGPGDGKKTAKYFERSRERVGWQVGRIYRARNRLAHVGDGADRVRDLVWHAHFYLTNLIAICVHHSEGRPDVYAQEILSARVGEYLAFLELLRQKDPTALSPAVLVRPRSLVG